MRRTVHQGRCWWPLGFAAVSLRDLGHTLAQAPVSQGHSCYTVFIKLQQRAAPTPLLRCPPPRAGRRFVQRREQQRPGRGPLQQQRQRRPAARLAAGEGGGCRACDRPRSWQGRFCQQSCPIQAAGVLAPRFLEGSQGTPARQQRLARRNYCKSCLVGPLRNFITGSTCYRCRGGFLRSCSIKRLTPRHSNDANNETP
jgi:hypothetical protein